MNEKKSKNDEKIYKMIFRNVYPLYVKKAERKGRTQEEVDEIICWLTGYSKTELKKHISTEICLEDFFNNAKRFNINASKISGVICGIRVEDIEDKIIQRVRYLDKLIDELAKGKTMDKIFRQ